MSNHRTGSEIRKRAISTQPESGTAPTDASTERKHAFSGSTTPHPKTTAGAFARMTHPVEAVASNEPESLDNLVTQFSPSELLAKDDDDTGN